MNVPKSGQTGLNAKMPSPNVAEHMKEGQNPAPGDSDAANGRLAPDGELQTLCAALEAAEDREAHKVGQVTGWMEDADPVAWSCAAEELRQTSLAHSKAAEALVEALAKRGLIGPR